MSITGFAPIETNDKSAENYNFTTELSEKGYLGFWRKRDQTCYEPTAVELNVADYFNAIQNTLNGVLNRLFEKRSQLPGETTTITNRIETSATILACGCCLMTYMKLTNHKPLGNLRSIPIPSGFAFAIQQLGIVNVADSPQERIFIPCFPNTGHINGVPNAQARLWNPNAYAQAVEYATTLGLHFATVDLRNKNGSAWWLFRQTYEEEIFELECSIPEVNFTIAMAVTHSLFLNGNELNPSRPFVNLDPVGTDNFGIMMRNPHLGIHLSSYEAIITQERN